MTNSRNPKGNAFTQTKSIGSHKKNKSNPQDHGTFKRNDIGHASNLLLDFFDYASEKKAKRINIKARKLDYEDIKFILNNETHTHISSGLSRLLLGMAYLNMSKRNIIYNELDQLLFDAIANYAEIYDSRDISHVIWSLARLGFTWQEVTNEKLDQILIDCITKNAEKGFTHQALNNILCSLVTLGLTWKEIKEAKLDQLLLDSIKTNAEKLNSQEISNTLLNLVDFGFTWEELKKNHLDEVLLDSIAININEYKILDVCMTLWSLSYLGVTWQEIINNKLDQPLLVAVTRNKSYLSETTRTQLKQAQLWFDFKLDNQLQTDLDGTLDQSPTGTISRLQDYIFTQVKKIADTNEIFHVEKRIAHVLDVDILTKKKVLEVDGPVHEETIKKITDTFKTRLLEKLGFQVYRISYKDLIYPPKTNSDKSHNDSVVKTILDKMAVKVKAKYATSADDQHVAKPTTIPIEVDTNNNYAIPNAWEKPLNVISARGINSTTEEMNLDNQEVEISITATIPNAWEKPLNIISTQAKIKLSEINISKEGSGYQPVINLNKMPDSSTAEALNLDQQKDRSIQVEIVELNQQNTVDIVRSEKEYQVPEVTSDHDKKLMNESNSEISANNIPQIPASFKFNPNARLFFPNNRNSIIEATTIQPIDSGAITRSILESSSVNRVIKADHVGNKAVKPVVSKKKPAGNEKPKTIKKKKKTKLIQTNLMSVGMHTADDKKNVVQIKREQAQQLPTTAQIKSSFMSNSDTKSKSIATSKKELRHQKGLEKKMAHVPLEPIPVQPSLALAENVTSGPKRKRKEKPMRLTRQRIPQALTYFGLFTSASITALAVVTIALDKLGYKN